MNSSSTHLEKIKTFGQSPMVLLKISSSKKQVIAISPIFKTTFILMSFSSMIWNNNLEKPILTNFFRLNVLQKSNF